MKQFRIIVHDLGLELEGKFKANSPEEAEKKAREFYCVELDCSEEDVNIISIEEIKATKEDVRKHLSKFMQEIPYSDKQIETALDLSIRRGNETKSAIVKDAVAFLYSGC
jgi:hypothetical protein